MPNANALTTVAERIGNNTAYGYSDLAANHKTLRHYGTEYIFSRVLMSINQRIQEHNKSNPDQQEVPLIMVSEQRKLHDEFVNILMRATDTNEAGETTRFNVASDANLSNDKFFCTALYSVLSNNEYWNYQTGKTEDEFRPQFRAEVEKFENEFIQRTGLGKPQNQDTIQNCLLPLSPLDDLFSTKETFLNHGGQILFAQLQYMSGTRLQNRSDWQQQVKLGYVKGNGFEDFGDKPLTTAGSLLTNNDIKGVSFLLPYAATDTEKNAIGEAFSDNKYTPEAINQLFSSSLYQLNQLKENGASQEEIAAEQEKLNSLSKTRNTILKNQISPEAMQKALNVLNYLMENGYRYTIEEDMRSGQISANITNTPYSVRIVDTTENKLDDKHQRIDKYTYIGRVYNYKTRDEYYVNSSRNGTLENSIPDKSIDASLDSTNVELIPLSYVLGTTPPNGVSFQKDQSIKNGNDRYNSWTVNEGDITIEVGAIKNKQNVPQHSNYQLHIAHNKLQRNNKLEVAEIHKESYTQIPADRSLDYLRNAVNSAKKNFRQELNLDSLIINSNNISDITNQEEVDRNMPIFSQTEDISDLQTAYWDVLTGKSTTIDAIGELPAYSLSDEGIDNDPIKLVRQHSEAFANSYIGSADPDEEGKRFNIMNTINFMDSPYTSIYDKEDEFVERLGYAKIQREELRGGSDVLNATMINRSIRFDPAEARSLKSAAETSEILKNAYDGIVNGIKTVPNCYLDAKNLDNAIKIDKHGVVQYEFYRVIGQKGMFDDVQQTIDDYNPKMATQKGHAKLEKVTGYLGQVFDYDSSAMARGHKVVCTNFVGEGESNYSFVPTQTAYIVPKTEDNNSNIGSRLRVNTYEKQMYDKVFKQVCTDLSSRITYQEEIGKSYSINSLYYGMTGEHMPYDYYNAMLSTGNSAEDIDIKIKQKASLVNLNADIRDNASAFEVYTSRQNAESRGMDNDNIHTVLADFNYQDVGVISPELKGYTDLYITGNAKNQGIHLYVVDGASIDSKTGEITPAKNADGTINTDARCELMKSSHFKHAKYDAADRQVMASNNFMVAESVASHIGFTQMSFGGWGYDDGFIISKDYADAYPVRKLIKNDKNQYVKNEDGSYKVDIRPRMIGDKLSDQHGNKGVIATIIDRNEYVSQDMIDTAKQELSEIKMAYQDVVERYSNALKSNEDYIAKSDDITREMELSLELDSLRPQQMAIVNRLDTVGLPHDEERSLRVELESITTSIQEINKELDEIKDTDSNTNLYRLNIELSNLMQETIEKHKEINHYEMVMFMQNNPSIDIIESPYSHTSRLNGGTAMDGFEEPFDVVMNDGTIKKGCAGRSDFNNLPQTVDTKTHIYEDDIHGRKASPQLAWALDSQKAYKIKDEFYGSNLKAFKDFRELANALGGDLDAFGDMHVGLDSVFKEKTERHVFHVNEDAIKPLDPSVSSSINRTLSAMNKSFENELNSNGGFMELPFQLNFDIYRELNDGYSTQRVTNTIPSAKEMIEKYPDGWLKNSDNTFSDNSYLLPVMSSKLRSGVELYDGERKSHDYTSYYCNIYRAALNYMNWEKQYKAGKTWDGKSIYDSNDPSKLRVMRKGGKTILDLMNDEKQNAQAELDKLAQRIKKDNFYNKHNIAKEKLMSKRISTSATSVWTADPYLPIDTIAMSKEMALQIGIAKEEDGNVKLYKNAGVIVWRDPILHDAGLRYYKVQLDSDIKGIKINGAMDKNFDGDFDGDTVAVVALHSKEARQEGIEKLSVAANLLDINAAETDIVIFGDDNKPVINPATNEPYTFKGLPLMMNDGMDLAAGETINPELALKRQILESRINMVMRKHCNSPESLINKLGFEQQANQFKAVGQLENAEACMKKAKDCEITNSEIKYRQNLFVSELTAYTAEAFETGFGKHIISFENVNEHLKSVATYMNDGAKAHGKTDKFVDYAKTFGTEVVINDQVLSNEKENTDLLLKEGKTIGLDFQLRRLGSEMIEASLDGRTITETGFTETDRMSQQMATNTKTQATGLAGAVSQRGIAALRCVEPRAVLELTYNVTQSVLQAKHDAREAERKFNYLQGIVKGVWDGKEIAKYDDNGNEIPYGQVDKVHGEWRFKKNIYNASTTYVNIFDESYKMTHNFMTETESRNLSPQAFKEMFNAFYKDKDGLGLSPNQEYLDLVTNALTTSKNGKEWVSGVSSNKVTNQMTVIDKMAYAYSKNIGKIEQVFNAHNGDCLYGDSVTQEAISHFMPEQIKKNITAKLENKLENVKEIVQSDNKVVVKKNVQQEVVQETKVVMQPHKLGLSY